MSAARRSVTPPPLASFGFLHQRGEKPDFGFRFTKNLLKVENVR